jgi:hypothetical protein
MIYTEILECFDRLHFSWRKIDQAIQALEGKFLTLDAWEALRRMATHPVLANISSTHAQVEAAATPEDGLNTAATFFDGYAADAEGTLDYCWNLIGLSNDDKKSQEVQDLLHLRNDVDVTRRRCLQEIREFQSASSGVAAGKISGAVRHAGNTVTGALKDVTTYPVLTQEVGYAPSPIAGASGSPATGAGGASLGATAVKAINDVLGWKLKADDPKGFLGALNASFTCQEIEGHTECTWTPRTYAVATDLAGGITGAQASIYTRAKEALDLALPLLKALYALDPTADNEDFIALQKVATDQMNELVDELGMLGGPRPSRVSQYFNLLLGVPFPMTPSTTVENDPDKIGGTLGRLREVLGLNSGTDDFVNSVDDEQDLTNFRILSDYMTSLAQSWVNNLAFFMTPPPLGTQPFFGTQLVLLSRQLSVVAESVDEVRFAMDSVFIGPAERQTLEIAMHVKHGSQPFSMYAEDLLSWISSFSTEEGPRIIQDGGKYAVGDAFALQVSNLHDLVQAAMHPANDRDLPPAYFTGRVQSALSNLALQLKSLVSLAKPIAHKIEATTSKELHPLVKAVSTSMNFDEFKRNVEVAEAKMRFAVPMPANVH